MVKQQVQLGMHKSTLRGFCALARQGGLREFFVGFNAAAARDVPFAAIQLALWEEAKRRLSLSGFRILFHLVKRTDANTQGCRKMGDGTS